MENKVKEIKFMSGHTLSVACINGKVFVSSSRYRSDEIYRNPLEKIWYREILKL